MKIKYLILILCSTFSLSAAANTSQDWVLGGEGGWREIFATNNDGYTLNFTCDMGAKNGTDDHAGERNLFISGGNGKKINASTKWSMESVPSVFTLKIGANSYKIENQATAPARREWDRFWKDVSTTDSKTVDVYVDGDKITTFNLLGASEIYKSAPEDGCLKIDTN